MNLLIKISIVFCFMVPTMFADTLDIDVDQSKLSVPYWPAKQLHYGGVLIVRGGEKAHWSDLLANFSKQLAENGWSVALVNCTENQTVPWIDQLPGVISSLRQNNNKRIVIVHYGDQLDVTLAYFNKPQAKMVNGLVLLSAYDLQNKLESPVNLRFPVFDIAGQFDYDVVLQQRTERESLIKAPKYLTIEMPGAQHDYQYSKQMLIAFVHGWMAKLPATITQPPPISVSYIEPVYFFSNRDEIQANQGPQPLASQIN